MVISPLTFFICLIFFSLTSQLFASPAAENYQPFETRDQNLFNLIHGQALPTNARLLDKSQNRWSSTLIITNALNIESNTNESIYLDYESYRFNLSYQYGLNENWNLKLDIPLIHQSGGLLDSAIDNWHELLGLPRANRPFVTNNQYEINYRLQNQNLINLNESSTRLGDIQLAATRSLLKNNHTSLSLWAGVKLPTGDEKTLSGSGATDISAWLALNQQLSESWLINLNGGVVVPGQDEYQNIPLSDQVLYGHFLLGWLVTEHVDLKVQLQGHTSYYDKSQLKILGDTYFMSFGTSIKINQCHHIDFAVSEDIKVDASPDASFLISWRGNISHC